MSAILITGRSGTGKSTAIDILAKRGFLTVETDDPGWCIPSDGDWTSHDRHWVWDESKLNALLDDHTHEHVIVSGCRPNQGRLYHRFDHIILLTAPLDVMLHRITTRSNNPFGHDRADREAIIRDTESVEPILRQRADVTIETSTASPTAVADRVVSLL